MNLSEVTDWVDQWAEKQRGMIALADALKSIGSIEQATTERQAALDAVTREYESKRAEVDATEADLALLRDSYAGEAAKQAVGLGDIGKAARDKADQIVVNAQAHADELIAAAQTEVERIQSAHAVTMAALNVDLEKARKDLADAQAATVAAKAEHDDVTAKTEAMKATARGLLA